MFAITANLSSTALLANPRAAITLTYALSDSDTFITNGMATVDWGDGSTESTGNVALPFGPVQLAHGYGPGTYTVRITAQNYRSPRPDTAVFQSVLVVTSSTAVQLNAAPVIFGPILPRSQGFPSPAQWSYNLGRDGVVLESSLRMLLLTSKGERIMDPNYGTRLRSLIFSLQGDDLSGAIRSEVVQAVATYEPRVEFLSSSLDSSDGGRTVAATFEFKSLLSNQPLVLTVGFTP